MGTVTGEGGTTVATGVVGVGGMAAGPPPAMADVPDLPPAAGEISDWAAAGLVGGKSAARACMQIADAVYDTQSCQVCLLWMMGPWLSGRAGVNWCSSGTNGRIDQKSCHAAVHAVTQVCCWQNMAPRRAAHQYAEHTSLRTASTCVLWCAQGRPPSHSSCQRHAPVCCGPELHHHRAGECLPRA